MANVVIKISFNTKREGHQFEVCPDGNDANDADGSILGERTIRALLESAMALMSMTGLAKWQIVENLETFVEELSGASTASIARSVRMVSQQ